MAKVLITVVDAPAPPRKHEHAHAHADGDPNGMRWPTLDRARRGEYERVIIVGSIRFHWEQLIGLTAETTSDDPQGHEEAHPQEGDASHEGHGDGDASSEETSEFAPAPEVPAAPEGLSSPSPIAAEESEHHDVREEVPQPTEPATTDAPQADTEQPAAAPSEVHPDATSGEVTAGPPTQTAQPERKERRHKEHRPPPQTEDELVVRLRMMQRTSRIDRAALDKLAEMVGQRYGLPEVTCQIAPPLIRERDQVAFVRGVLNWPHAGDRVLVDLADGPRAFAALGVAIAHAFPCLRPEVQVEDVIVERGHGLPVSTRHLVAMLHSHELWQELREGVAPLELTEQMRREPRLHAIAEPYHRFVRALDFGNPAETARWARVLDERREHLRKFGGDGTQHPYVGALSAAISPFGPDEPWSHRQLAMASNAVKRGNLHLGALHVREALVSGLIEAYGQNPTKGWVAATPEGGAHDRVRMRDVMAWVLGTENAGELVPDLAKLWEWVENPRMRFLMSSPVTLDPNLLREGATAIEQIPRVAGSILTEGRFKAIVDALPLERAVQIALEHDAVRAQAPRGRRGSQSEARGEPSDGGADGASHAGPQQPRPTRNRPPRDAGDRPPRQDTRGPREVSVRPPAGPGPRDDHEQRHSSVPVGGVIKVERARSGLGNLGLALMNAGLAPAQKPDRNKDRGSRKDDRAAGPPSDADAKSADAHPSEPSSESSPPPPEPAAEPPPPAPSFDVAGPIGTEPAV